jgi:hypothetical protein
MRRHPILIVMSIFAVLGGVDAVPARVNRDLERAIRLTSELRQMEAAQVEETRAYLRKRCAQDERLFISGDIRLETGILLQQDARALTALAREAPPMEDEKRIAYHMGSRIEPQREASVEALRQLQYGRPIVWHDHPLYDAWNASLLPDPLAPLLEIDNPEAGGKPFLRRASREVWENQKWREMVRLAGNPALRWASSEGKNEQYMRLLYESLPMISALEVPVDASAANYLLHIEDISTLDDRTHWVARGRLRLIRKADQKLMAEYVGFSANVAPFLRDDWDKTESCPCWNDEPRGLYDKHWPALGFFLRRIDAAARQRMPFSTPVSGADGVCAAGLNLASPLSDERAAEEFIDKNKVMRMENLLFQKNSVPTSALYRKNPDDPDDVVLRNVRGRNFILPRRNIGRNIVIERVISDSFLMFGSDEAYDDLTVRDVMFQKDEEYSRIGAPFARRALFERVSGSPQRPLRLENGVDKEKIADAGNESVVFRASRVGDVDAWFTHVRHLRVESILAKKVSVGAIGEIEKLDVQDSQLDKLNLGPAEKIGTLTIVDSEIGIIDAGKAEIDVLRILRSKAAISFSWHAKIGRLEIVDSEIDGITLSNNARIEHVEISASPFKRFRVGKNAGIGEIVAPEEQKRRIDYSQ